MPCRLGPCYWNDRFNSPNRPHDTRDEIVDFVRTWCDKTEVPNSRLRGWIGVGTSKFLDGKLRFGKVNEHHAWVPRNHWLTAEERERIVTFARQHPLDGYRRLTYLMLDDARRLVARFVEHYHTARLHSALGYVTPRANGDVTNDSRSRNLGRRPTAPALRPPRHRQLQTQRSGTRILGPSQHLYNARNSNCFRFHNPLTRTQPASRSRGTNTLAVEEIYQDGLLRTCDWPAIQPGVDGVVGATIAARAAPTCIARRDADEFHSLAAQS